MKLQLLLLASLALALTGAILMMVKGLDSTAMVLLAVGFGCSVAFGLRVMRQSRENERAASAAIRERAQQNWDMAHKQRQA